MKLITLSKHGLTLALLVCLAVGIVQLSSMDVAEKHFGNRIISGTFFLSLFILITTYRIDWIGRNKINWITSILFAINLAALLLMLVSPKNVMALWKPAVACYIAMTTFILFLKLNRKNWSSIVARVFLVITAVFFLATLLVRIGEPLYYSLCWTSLLLTGLFALLQLIVPEKGK